MRENVKLAVCLCLIFFLFYGCAHRIVAPPTEEELVAVRPLKKTVAVLPAKDTSRIKGFSKELTLFVSDLFSNLGTVNCVERDKIEEILKERNLELQGITEGKVKELGKLLGADYLVFPEVIGVDIEGPQLKYSTSKKKDGSFWYGEIWDEIYGITDISIRVVDVASGVVKYSYTKRTVVPQKLNIKTYEEEAEADFKEELGYKRDFKEVNPTVRFITEKTTRKEDLTPVCKSLIVESLKEGVSSLKREIKWDFPAEGEILKVVSDKEVLVNLGSAYGIKPGEKLIVWEEGKSIKDPKTGITTVIKKKKGIIKVIEVTSGLTSIARGSKRLISQVRRGDKVTTFE